MNNETNTTPLYKVLNSERTQGNWEVNKWETKNGIGCHIQSNTIIDGKQGIMSIGGLDYSRHKANAEYIVLAVTNLASIAEALEKSTKQLNVVRLIMKDYKDDTFLKVLDELVHNNVEALSKIS